MKRLIIIICIVLCASSAYAVDKNGYWTPNDYDREYNQRVQNERFDRIERMIRSNSPYRTYRNQGY